MSVARGTPCPTCDFAPLLRFETNGSGHAVETVLERCDCAEREAEARARADEAADRKRRGICQDCDEPVEGTVGKAERCGPHKAERARLVARRAEKVRRQKRTPAQRRRHRANKRAWEQRNRERIRARREARREQYAAAARARYPKIGTPEYEVARKKRQEKYQRRKEKAKAYAREHYRKNRERILAEKAAGRALARRLKEQAARRDSTRKAA